MSVFRSFMLVFSIVSFKIFLFFFNDTATTEIYTLSLHDALPIGLVVGIAYFVAARFSLALLTAPDGVAVFWPSAGIASGALIALGPVARRPVVLATMA